VTDRGPSTRWAIVMLAVGAGVVAAFQIGKAPAAIPVLRNELDIGLVTAGWVLSIFNVVGVAIAIFAGAIADSLGHRRLMLWGLAGIAVASALGSLAPSAPILLATRVLEGFGFIIIVVAGPGVIVRAADAAHMRLAFSLWGTYMPAGTAAMLLVSPLLLDALGWRGLWLINAALAGIYALILAGATRDFAGRPERESDARRSLLHDVRETVTAPGPVALALCFATYTGNFIAVMGFLPTFLSEDQGWEAGPAAAVAAAAIATNVLGNLSAGALLHRGARRWILITIASAVMGLSALGIFADVLPVTARLGLCFLFALTGGLLPTSVLAATTDYTPRRDLIGTTNGLIMQGSNLGQMIGPPSVAALVTAFGSWTAAPLYVTSAAALGIAFALVIRRLRGRS